MAVTDAKGGIVEQYNYTPYGELITGEYREDIPFLYNGQYGVITDNNGLYYMRARYYNVEIKRFINQDVLLGVLERVSSLNRYAYVEGNPISYLDPFGLAVEVIQKFISVVSVAISGLKLLRFIAPEAMKAVEIALSITSIALDVVQLVRYGAEKDKINALIIDISSAVYDTFFPFLNTNLSLIEKSFGETATTKAVHDIFNMAMDYMDAGVTYLVNMVLTMIGYDQ